MLTLLRRDATCFCSCWNCKYTVSWSAAVAAWHQTPGDTDVVAKKTPTQKSHWDISGAVSQ